MFSPDFEKLDNTGGFEYPPCLCACIFVFVQGKEVEKFAMVLFMAPYWTQLEEIHIRNSLKFKEKLCEHIDHTTFLQVKPRKR